MSRAVFTVTEVGPLVTIQDGGRRGLMRFGVPESGPMDRGSFALANLALGNGAAAPAIEISMGGLTLECIEGEVTFAVAGGGFQVALDETSFGSWNVATIRAGARLAVKPGPWGSWTYLAFAGALASKQWFNSAATHGPTGLGGGRLVRGDRIVVEEAALRGTGAIPCPVSARPRHAVRVVLGPQDRFFPQAAIDALLSNVFKLTDSYDRMGVRLSGPSLRPDATLDMPSEAIVRGSIQVSGDGAATVLLADHQTTGGYPKIATIVSDDLDGFVQLRSRSQVEFKAVTPAAAIESARTRHVVYEQMLESLKGRGGQRPADHQTIATQSIAT
jgi:biotin-dependent carboxylase-like uncharacterized protein